MPQALGLLPELTVEENITAPVFLAPDVDPADHRRLMADLGIEHLAGRYPAETSLGEQQRAAVARALVLRPASCWPTSRSPTRTTSGPRSASACSPSCAMRGTAFLVATHDLAVLNAADRAVELHDGRLNGLRPGETGSAQARRGSRPARP